MLLNYIKRHWLGWHLQRRRRGDAQAISRLYCFRDPWGLDKPEEHFRFQETRRLIREKLGTHFGSILEIGCGEGLQTKYLAELADRVTGIDPGPLAVKRARRLGLPNATFEVADLMTFERRNGDRFDLATACEVMYYMPDLEKAYARLNELARACIVTYYEGVYDRLDPFFLSRKVECEIIRVPACEWRVIWWRN